MDYEVFKELSSIKHNNKYIYPDQPFINVRTKITIICPEHGPFLRTPASHLNGYGCPKEIVNSLMMIEDFIERAGKIYNNFYIYTKFTYINARVKGIIICPKHGEFEQTPDGHLRGRCGCIGCCSGCVSKNSQLWLDMLNIPMEHRERRIIISDEIWFRVDAYDQETNTVYEFWGDYWHGNPERFDKDDMNKRVGITYGELYNKTTEKERILKEAGYTVISIWEKDFDNILKKNLQIYQ